MLSCLHAELSNIGLSLSTVFFFRNEKTLLGLEKKHGIRLRWQENDATFRTTQQQLSKKKQDIEVMRLHKMASERIFLLELKAKYAGLYFFYVRCSLKLH